MLYCPACSEEAKELIEGYCDLCWNSQQQELDLHNARHDWWNSLSDAERDKQIKWATR